MAMLFNEIGNQFIIGKLVDPSIQHDISIQMNSIYEVVVIKLNLIWITLDIVETNFRTIEVHFPMNTNEYW